MPLATMTRTTRASRPRPGRDPGILTEGEAAAVLGKSVRTLRRWRRQGIGPKFSKSGCTTVYRRVRIDEYLESRECESNEDAKPYVPAARRSS